MYKNYYINLYNDKFYLTNRLNIIFLNGNYFCSFCFKDNSVYFIFYDKYSSLIEFCHENDYTIFYHYNLKGKESKINIYEKV